MKWTGFLLLAWLWLAGFARAEQISGDVEFLTNPPGLDVYLLPDPTQQNRLVAHGKYRYLHNAPPRARLRFGYRDWLAEETFNINCKESARRQRWPESGQPVEVSLPWPARLTHLLDHQWPLLLGLVGLAIGLAWRRRRPAVRPAPSVRPQAAPSLVPGYLLEGPLGAGGMGEVFRGRSQETGQEVAIKVLKTGLSEVDESRKRFNREIRACKDMRHPNIVPVLDWGETQDGRPYLVMELLRGHTLGEELAERTPDAARSLYILQQVCLALEVLHQKELVHRDIKPENLFVLEESGRVVLMDFGAVRGGNFTVHTEEGAGIGTPSYMAPEQIGGQAVPASDQYSLGVLAFRLFTGRRPFEQVDLVPLLHAHLQQPAPDPREFNPHLPAATAHVILRMLEKDPARRFPDITQAGQALARSLDGEEATLV